MLIGLLTTVYAYVHTHRPSEWFEEDWLINYQAGFIRRELYGEFSHFMHKLLGINTHVVCLYSAARMPRRNFIFGVLSPAGTDGMESMDVGVALRIIWRKNLGDKWSKR